MRPTRVAALLDLHQPGRSTRSIEASAGVSRLARWLDSTAPDQPTEPAEVDLVCRVASAIDVPVSMVSRAFTGTWYDLNGWEWNHFRPGDRVVVFSAPDPLTTTRHATKGLVLAVDPLDVIYVQFDDGTKYSRMPETEGTIAHLSGDCHCVTT
ncbi:hypothetical protein [Umezawaea sp. NPDC059074]|uniref:hypothetical protein n=1 Tax=Umezawaea sp. NPDC059074 TaxID=3346716 RepID=UPI0036A3C753